MNATALAIVVATSPAAPAHDVRGWREAHWGMTEQAVLEAFKGEAVRLATPREFPKGTGRVEIPSITLGGVAFGTMFQFDGKGRLVQTTLQPVKEAGASEFTLGQIEALLTQKYGKPTFVNRGSPDDRRSGIYEITVLWQFPSTTIRLWLMRLAGDDILALIYSKPDQDLGKL